MSEVELPTPPVLRERLQKVCLVTGAASGIGFATAQLFAQSWARVVLVDLDESKVRAAAEKIGLSTSYYACDVSSWSQQVAMFDWVCRTYGPPEIVCLNAGIDPELTGLESAEGKGKVAGNWLADEYEAGTSDLKAPPSGSIFDVNVQGVIYGMKLAIHHLAESNGGRIIVTGSAASYMPVPYQDVYAASKHAVLGLIRSVSRREEVKSKKIFVSMVAPWFTKTAMTANLPPDLFSGSEKSEPADVALGIAYLAVAEDEADVNGKCLWVRGKRCFEVESSYGKWLGDTIQATT